MSKITLDKEQEGLFNSFGTIVNTAQGGIYKFFPFWLKKLDEGGEYELVGLDNVPEDLRDWIDREREGIELEDLE